MSGNNQKLVRFDWAMKNILRNKANFDILEGFLTSLLNEEIKIQELLESEGNKKRADEKNNRVDLKCKDSEGREIIIEIQAQYEYDYLHRILFGTSKAIVERVSVGEKYRNIPKVISVNILFHEIEPDINKGYIYYGKTEIKNLFNGRDRFFVKFDRDLLPEQADGIMPEYYFLCVGNFKGRKIKEKIDEWMYFFKNEAIEKKFHAPGIKEAEKKLNYLAMPKEAREEYERYREAIRHEEGVLDTAVSEAENRGRAEGKAEGKAEGRAEGERAKAIETATQMLSDGVSIENIVKWTGLSESDIQSILRKGKFGFES